MFKNNENYVLDSDRDTVHCVTKKYPMIGYRESLR